MRPVVEKQARSNEYCAKTEKIKGSERFFLLIAVLVLVGNVLVSFSTSLRAQKRISSSGEITYYPILVDVSVDFSKAIGINNLSLGVQIGYEWFNFVKYPELQNKLVASRFKIVRFFVYNVQPCVSWNETTKTGTYDWTEFDYLMQTIQTVGVEDILVCIAHNYDNPKGLPQGMNRDYNNTGFPNPESFAVYSKDIAFHVKEKGWSVRYWEPHNEPYFKDNASARAFVDLFNSASDAILQVFPDALFGVDASNRKSFLDSFVHYGRNVGFLSFHKYDASGTWIHNPEGHHSDEQVLKTAGMFGSEYYYTPQEMRDKWRSVKGAELPIFVTESNLNWCYINGTDPRIQEVIGAVWYAEMLRALILNDVKYCVYFTLASNDSPRWGKDVFTNGYGFGMVNMTPPHTEWYPYLVNHFLGNYLNVGDKMSDCSSSNLTAVSTLAWSNGSSNNVLLIGKTKGTVKLRINVENLPFDYGSVSIFKIDGSDPKLQESKEPFAKPLSIVENGYFVIILNFS